MTHTITISGKPFTVEPRYAEGHVLNANEASALNQTFFENLRNNFAGSAKEGKTQADFDTYVSSYQFGVRTGGGGSRDPIETEAMNMARDSVKQAIKGAGKNVSDYSAKSITAAAEKLLAKDPKFRELAAKRVEEMRANASTEIDADLLDGLEPAAPAENDTEASGTTEDVGGDATAAASTSRRKATA